MKDGELFWNESKQRDYWEHSGKIGIAEIGRRNGFEWGVGIGTLLAAWGWMLDPLDPAESILVEIYVDGPVRSEILVATAMADQPRPEVNEVWGVPGTTAFSGRFPPSLKPKVVGCIFMLLTAPPPSRSAPSCPCRPEPCLARPPESGEYLSAEQRRKDACHNFDDQIESASSLSSEKSRVR